MNFIRLLLAEAGEHRKRLIFVSVLPGIAMSFVIGLVTTVSDYDQSKGPHLYLLGFFVAACATVLVTMNYGQNATTAILTDYLDRTRLRIADQVRTLDYATYERIGPARIEAAVGRDLQTIEEAAPVIIGLIYFVMQLLSSALYIGYLSGYTFIITVVIFAFATYFYRRTYAVAEDLSKEATDRETAFRSSLTHLLHGFRELKLNRRGNDELFDQYLVEQSADMAEFRLASGRSFNWGQTISDVFFYTLMGVIVFTAPYYVSDTSVPNKVTLVIVFSAGAIGSIVRTFPMISSANLAVGRLDALDAQLAGAGRWPDTAIEAPAELKRGLSARGLTYAYHDADGQPGFTVGPCDLDIAKGELLFIVGGNGSGKSTLINMLTWLYTADAGSLSWDDAPVTAATADRYRQLFSVVFADFHLFDRLYGTAADPAAVNRLLLEMKLAGKVTFRDGAFSSTDLSTGQRKRLALVAARLEDRPVLILDEWAADQDPSFRRYFYETLLPALQAEGRTIIAITHDDRYLHVADRVVWMEEGRITRVDARASEAR